MDIKFDEFTKSNLKSDKFRNEGNQFYTQKKFFEALLKYNESLCFAEDDEHLALVCANRSAVYMEMKMYQQCLNNIRLAKEHNYPENKLAKLLERETRCLELIMQASSINSEPFDFFKLSYKANPKIPFIIDDLELKTNAKYGRHIITKRDLKVGDIISVEDSFFYTLESDPEFQDVEPTNKFNFCHFCLEENRLDLIPCGGCNATMYCSEKCQNSAHSYHQYECILSGIFQNAKYEYVVFRFFFKALSIVKGSIEELEKIFNECLETKKTVFDFNFSDPSDPNYTKNQLRCALSLAKNDLKTEFHLLDALFPIHPLLSRIWKTHQKFIRRFVLHLFQVQGQTLSQIDQPTLAKNFVNKACGNFLFGALVNHSCAPNLLRINAGGQQCLVVTRPIAKGEQLFDCYSRSFVFVSKKKREKHLKHYNFKCDCEACLDPTCFTLMENLKKFNINLLLYAEVAEQLDYESMSIEQLIEHATKITSMLQVTFKTDEFPSYEYAKLSNVLHQCLERIIYSQYIAN